MTEFVEWLTGTHKCGCGAEYKVTVTEAPTANVTCEKCGTLMDRPANKSFLTYQRLPRNEWSITSGHLNARLASIPQTVINLIDPMKSAKTNVGSRATASANVSNVIAL